MLELCPQVVLAQEDGARTAVLDRLDERDDLVDVLQVLERVEGQLERLAAQALLVDRCARVDRAVRLQPAERVDQRAVGTEEADVGVDLAALPEAPNPDRL